LFCRNITSSNLSVRPHSKYSLNVVNAVNGEVARTGEAWEKGRVKDCYWPVVSGQLRERRRGTQACCRGRMPIGGPGERYFGQISGFSRPLGRFCMQVFGEQFVEAKYMASPSPTFASLLALTPSHPEDNVPAYRGMVPAFCGSGVRGICRTYGAGKSGRLKRAGCSLGRFWLAFARFCSLGGGGLSKRAGAEFKGPKGRKGWKIWCFGPRWPASAHIGPHQPAYCWGGGGGKVLRNLVETPAQSEGNWVVFRWLRA
jgi:hypothetical protein